MQPGLGSDEESLRPMQLHLLRTANVYHKDRRYC